LEQIVGLTLARGEREWRCQRWARTTAEWHFAARRCSVPSPGGEGKGEGEPYNQLHRSGLEAPSFSLITVKSRSESAEKTPMPRIAFATPWKANPIGKIAFARRGAESAEKIYFVLALRVLCASARVFPFWAFPIRGNISCSRRSNTGKFCPTLSTPSELGWVLQPFPNYVIYHEDRPGEILLIRMLHGAQDATPLFQD
jgi:hypothetical protein